MAKRPCSKCGKIWPEGECPKHPKAARWRNRPYRSSTDVYRSPEYRQGRTFVLAEAELRHAGKCRYCVVRAATTADHIVPLHQGGARGVENLAACCSTCNTSKGPRTIAEWIHSGLAPSGAAEFLGRGARA
jgi:5-methylcytosine-specific restriction endonuclease McrA